MMMATGRRFAGAYDLLHGGLVPKRDYGSYCIVVARCGRLASSSTTVLRVVGSTAAIGEPGLQHDLPAILDKLIPPSRNYGHEQTWHDTPSNRISSLDRQPRPIHNLAYR
jgi:hypothetical protein